MNSLNTNTDLKKYLPDCYKGIVEVEAEQDALSIEMDHLNETFQKAMMDQFIQYCSIEAIGYYEDIFNIIADPLTETLQVRRERIINRMRNLRPPYTKWYLRKILDKLFGNGNYTLDINNEEFTITIESSASSSLWYHELQVTMTAIKPCNMIFINKPQTGTNLITNEVVSSSASTRNYKLNGTWRLGLKPFISLENEEVRKMATTSSVQQHFIDTNLTNWESLFVKILINNSVEITEISYTQDTDSLILEYMVGDEDVSTITNIKVLDEDDITLLSSNVYIPVEDSVTVKHTISLKEGV